MPGTYTAPHTHLITDTQSGWDAAKNSNPVDGELIELKSAIFTRERVYLFGLTPGSETAALKGGLKVAQEQEDACLTFV